MTHPEETTPASLAEAAASNCMPVGTIAWDNVKRETEKAIRLALSASHLAKEGGEAGRALLRDLDFHIEDSDNGFSKVPRATLSRLRAALASLPRPSPAAKGGDAVREALEKIIATDRTEPMLYERRWDGIEQAIGNADGECAAIARAALAALSASHLAKEGGEAGTVEALKWARTTDPSEGSVHYGTGVFGHWYAASRVKPKVWSVNHHIDGKNVIVGLFESLQSAYAAAQSDYDCRIRAALSTPTEGPASQTEPDVEPGQGSWAKRRAQMEAPQTEGMGRDALREALKSAISWIEDLPRKNSSHQMRDDVLDDLRAALASDPAPATDDRERLVEALKSAAVSLEQAAGRFNLMGGVGLVNGADPKAGYAEAYEASCVARAALATEASR